MVKDIFSAKKRQIYYCLFCTMLLFVLNNLPPYTVIQHHTIIKFDRFSTLYCYLDNTFIWHSKVPVSLLSVPCKIFEHILVSHMMDHLDKNNILSPLQHGFRKGRSCETQLLELGEELTDSTEKGLQTNIILMDFAKAFDKVNHSLLTHKLDHYSIRGQANLWAPLFYSL